MLVVKYRKIFFALSFVLFAVSIYGMFTHGFDLSIDFKGGTITEVKYAGTVPTVDELNAKIATLNLGGVSVRSSGTSNLTIRSKELTTAEKDALAQVLDIGEVGGPTLEKQNTIGPVAGAELMNKAIKAVAIVILMIVLFITFAFRGVSEPVSSWKYGVATIVALAHDVIIPAGVFVFLGEYYGMQIDLLFVTGLLAILGYSVHDTIVVFDRVRENLKVNHHENKREEFEITVGKSVSQTFARSINTSVTIFITLLALYLFGSSATHEFSLLLIIGVIIGTYSSIFIASPLLVTFYKLQKK